MKNNESNVFNFPRFLQNVHGLRHSKVFLNKLDEDKSETKFKSLTERVNKETWVFSDQMQVVSC